MGGAELRRHVRRYRAVGRALEADAAAAAGGDRSLSRRGGWYVVTGGLGALGREVVRLLLDDDDCAGCRVLVIGRQSASDAAAQLAAFGSEGRLTYASVDLGADYTALRDALGRFCHGGGPLTACLHLAGTYGRATAAELSSDALAAATRAKAAGAVHLHRAAIELEQHPAFVHFGSVATTFAGHGLGGYAAGNEFLEWFASYQRERCAVDARCIAWASWGGIGISARDETLGMASWLAPLPLRHGIGALRALLGGCGAGAHHHLRVGVRARDAAIRPLYVDGDGAAAEATRCVFYTPDQLPSLDAIAAGAMPVCVPKLPRAADGSVDVDALRTLPLHELTGRRPAATGGDGDGDGDDAESPEALLASADGSCGACSAACARRAASRPPPPTMSSSSSVCRR